MSKSVIEQKGFSKLDLVMSVRFYVYQAASERVTTESYEHGLGYKPIVMCFNTSNPALPGSLVEFVQQMPFMSTGVTQGTVSFMPICETTASTLSITMTATDAFAGYGTVHEQWYICYLFRESS